MLTASGGPFRGRSRDELDGVSPAQALAHPTWSMGPKITVDSATLMNKGLELIEAHYLFGLGYDRIEVVVHPTSIVHSLVCFRDGAALAHLGYPDMRVPISYALTYPERSSTPIPSLDLAAGLTLEFSAPDEEAFPCLRLAREAGEAGATAPCVLNAANEVAVGAFLSGELPFLGIAEVVERTLAAADCRPARDLPDLVEIDAGPRRRRPRSRGQLVSPMNSLIAIGGLAFLVLIHEAGPLRLGHLPWDAAAASSTSSSRRRFAKRKRDGIEYGIGSIPLGGYVEDSRHAPAGAATSTPTSAGRSTSRPG